VSYSFVGQRPFVQTQSQQIVLALHWSSCPFKECNVMNFDIQPVETIAVPPWAAGQVQ